MASRFENAGAEVVQMVEDMVEEQFPQLEGAAINVVFDTKKRKSGGQYVLGRLQKTNDLMRYLSESDEHPNGFDYILYLDKNVFNELSTSDKNRLIFHELCHADVDFEKNDPYRIRNHEIEGFFAELDYNQDDRQWDQRVATIASSVHEKDE